MLKISRLTVEHLAEGCVRAIQGEEVEVLSPGEQAEITSQGMAVREVNVENYTAWRKKRFVFRSEPFPDLVKELERWLATDSFDPAEKIAAVTRLYDAIGVGALCEDKIQAYTRLAEENLRKVGVDATRKLELEKLLETLVSRSV